MTHNQTSFKRGNKAGLGNPNSGRPREYDPEIEAEALLQWAKEDDKYILRAFAPERGYAPSRMDEWIKTCPAFQGAYAVAKALIGVRREQILIDSGSSRPFERYADWYDELLLAHEQMKELFSATTKARAEASVNAKPNEEANLKMIQDQIKALQDLHASLLSKAENNKSTDNIS